MNAHHGESHACEVAIRVTYKDLCGIPVVSQQTKRSTDKWENEAYCEKQVLVASYCTITTAHGAQLV